MFGLIKETVKNSPFVISEKTQQILSQGISDPDDLHYVMEELAGIQAVDLRQFPIGTSKPIKVSADYGKFTSVEAEKEAPLGFKHGHLISPL